MNSPLPVPGRTPPKSRGHAADKRTKRNLMLMGSAAVIAVYSAGFFHTAAAAAKVAADERNRADSRHRGNEREPSLPATPAATVANLPVTSPMTPPPAAVPATLQTPAPAPVAVPAPPSAPAPAVAEVTSPAAPVPTPASVPTAPVQVAALPLTPAAPGVPTATPVAAETAAPKKYKDGAYFGWGYCRHGQLKVTVELKDDQIVSANITECYTQYSRNVIARLPKQLVALQNANKLDRIAGASDSSDAYYYAVVEALKAAKL